jgi:hypothetical protein
MCANTRLNGISRNLRVKQPWLPASMTSALGR